MGRGGEGQRSRKENIETGERSKGTQQKLEGKFWGLDLGPRIFLISCHLLSRYSKSLRYSKYENLLTVCSRELFVPLRNFSSCWGIILENRLEIFILSLAHHVESDDRSPYSLSPRSHSSASLLVFDSFVSKPNSTSPGFAMRTQRGLIAWKIQQIKIMPRNWKWWNSSQKCLPELE